MLFEVVILEKPTVNQMNDGQLPRIIIGPVVLVAKDAQSAAMQVGMQKDLPDFDRTRMEVCVRSF